ncbi:MAG: 23S rRNA (pseudouridine(1915)-N(3))-methyltransferase RlmH [Bacteriovoracaceae bacterium]
MSKEVHLIVVGKLKDSHLEAIEADYLKRIANPLLKIHEVKASAENKAAEGEAVQKKIRDISPNSAHVILLAENGKLLDSPKFSEWLYTLVEEKSEKLIFVIAGAEGHSEEMLQIAQGKISLSALTFPHKLARILFIEQFYRAQTIKRNHPYHN